MKKPVILFFITLGVISASCQKEVIETSVSSPSSEYEYLFELETSKATLGENCIEWENGDRIGTFAGGLDNHAGDISLGKPCTFKVKSSKALTPGQKVFAYYPYSTDAGIHSESLNVSIPKNQSIGAAGFDADAMPLASVPYIVQDKILPGTTTPVGSMHFRNLGAILKFNLYSNGTVAKGEKIQSVKFKASGNICGTYSVNISDEKFTLTPKDVGNTVISTFAEPVDVPASKTSAVACCMVIAPSTVGGTIYVTTNKAVYAKTISSRTYARNTLQPFALSIATMTNITSSFNVTGAQSFSKGQAQTSYTLTTSLTGISVKSYPSGWTVSYSGNKLYVKSPSAGATSYKPSGEIILQAGGIEICSLRVRLYGINDKDDLLAFREAHGGTDAQHTEKIKDINAYNKSMAPFKVDGWVVFNADIDEAVKGSEFVNSGCNFMHHIREQIDGQGHTVNLDVNGNNTAAILSFFQHIDVPVKNLKFAGQMTQTAFDACAFATLAQQISADVTVENVNSSVNLTTTAKNCIIGGILSRGASAAATLKNCSYSGTISVSAPTNVIGGVNGQQTNGKGEYIMMVDGCKFSGNIAYTSTAHHASSRFGGIFGDQGRNATIKNCINSGKMTLNVQDAQIAAANGSGIGGIVGRCNATTSGYTMSTTVKDCSFTGVIIIDKPQTNQPKTYINKIVGTKLSGYNTAGSTGNVETGTITYNSPDAVGTLAFTDASELSFKCGETKTIAITVNRMKTLKAVAEPTGWFIDFKDWKSGKIYVTAPKSVNLEEMDRTASLVLIGEDENSAVHQSSAKAIRLYGINNAGELAAFTSIYDNKSDNPVTSGIDKYLVNGEISINDDITIPAGSIAYNAYWLKNLVLPLNGNNHTLTYNTTLGHRGGLVQNLKADVHDLKLAGSIEAVNPGANSAQIGGLACANYKNGAVISNVHSSVQITVSGNSSVTTPDCIGGLVGGTSASNYTLNFVNCSVSGDMAYSVANTAYIGGIVSYTRGGQPGCVNNLTNCSHSGNMNVTFSAAKDIRVGGMIGSNERKAILTSCTNSGNITIDCNGYAYSTSNTGGGHGLGGLIGYQRDQLDGYDMTCRIINCTNSGRISLLRAIENAFNVESKGTAGCVGQFVGKNLNFGKTYSEEGNCVRAGSVEIVYMSDGGIEKATGHFSLQQVTSISPSEPSVSDNIGNSYILKTNGGKVIVLDGGVSGESEHLRELLLNKYGGTVDQWWVSHPHADHVGAMLEILENPRGIKVKEVYHSRFTEELIKTEGASTYARRLYNILDNSTTIRTTDIQKVGGLYAIDGILIKVLGVSNPDILTKDDNNSPYNNSSMILRIWDKDKSVLFLGDTQEMSEKKVLQRTEYLKYLTADYVQMAHHGQRGVTQSFYNQLSFSYCLWPTPKWLWSYGSYADYKTKETKQWMKAKGIDEDKWFVSCLIKDWELK